MGLPNLSVLVKKCETLGLDYLPKDGKKLGKDHCVQALRAHYLPPEGLPYEEITPMLCFAEWNLKPAEIDACYRSPKWAAQTKFNGFRLVLHLVKGVGLYAHTRTISEKTFRYEDTTSKLLIKDWIPTFDATIDIEAIIDKPVDTNPYTKGKKGTITKSSLHSAVAVAHLNAEGAIALQRDQDAPFVFHAFDVMRLNGQDLRRRPLRERELFRLGELRSAVLASPIGQYFRFPELVYEDRKAFAEKVKAEGGEGVIWKNLDSPYIDSSSRPRTGWVKHKKRIEFDAFVSGFKPGEKGSGYENLVGALEWSVHLKEGGTHVLGFTSNMTLAHREKMTVTVNGEPTLHKSIYGRVGEISGQDVSAREFRLSHCTHDRWRHHPAKGDQPAGPDHKTADQCVVSMQDLREAAEWVA